MSQVLYTKLDLYRQCSLATFQSK